MSNKVYEIVTEQIIKKLEEGTAPWQRPWNASLSTPMNFERKRRYQGINVFLLLMAGFNSPYWLTFKQAQKLGGQVRKGEHGTLVVYWRMLDIEDTNEAGETVTKKIPFLRYHKVFNAEQIDGIDFPEPEVNEHQPTQAAEVIVKGYPNAPKINHGGGSAHYSPTTDEITVPEPGHFLDSDKYYSTLFHEMAHSSGHTSRLDRWKSSDQFNFGSHSYGREELVAEMGAAFLSAEAGITTTLNNSAAYLASWIKTIKEDPKMVVWAAGKAQKAADHILGRDQEQE